MMAGPRAAAGLDAARYGELLEAVRGLRWPARRLALAPLPGIHQSRVRGASAEFTEYRPYRQGDDVRRIDWRLLARSDRAQVRVSEERVVSPTIVVLDSTASLDFPAGRGATSKWIVASQLAIGLAAVASASGDPIGLIIGSAAQAVLPPRTRRDQLVEMIRGLTAAEPAGDAPLAPAVLAAVRHAARIVIVSDFLGDADPMLNVARQAMAAGRDVHAVHVTAAEEVSPPDGALIATDPEQPEIRRPLDRGSRAAYLDAFNGWRASLADEWIASGAAYWQVVCGAEPVHDVIRRIARDQPAGGATS